MEPAFDTVHATRTCVESGGCATALQTNRNHDSYKAAALTNETAYSGTAATTSSITSAPAGNAAAWNAVRAGNGVTPRPGSQEA